MANRLPLIALVTAALLGVWVFMEWRFNPRPGIDANAETIEPLPDDPRLPEPEGEFTPIDEFKGTLVRPLFVKGRRQEPDEAETVDANAQAGPPAAPPPDMKLSAIIVNDEERFALLLPAGQAQSEQVKEGETIAGWEIVSIEDESVVIRARGRGEQTLTLRDFGPPGAVPRRPATPERPSEQRPAVRPKSADSCASCANGRPTGRSKGSARSEHSTTSTPLA